MLDGDVPEKTKTIWGFTIPTLHGGRRRWPKDLRAMAVEKVAAGQGIREIAEEIGANKSLVAVWMKSTKREDPIPSLTAA